MLDGDDLRVFEAFARTLNFTHAAREVHLTQPAVHGIVARLSENLAAPLYVRKGRGLQLTVAGRELAAFARESAARESALRARLRGEEPETPVVLAAGEGAFLALLGPGLRAFLRGGRTQLKLLTRDGDGAVEAVRSGEAHVGVAVLANEPRGLEVQTLTEVGAVLAMPRRHRLTRRRHVTFAALAGEPLIAPPEGRPLRTRIDDGLAAARVRAPIAVEASGWALMVQFVELGLGVAIVNDTVRLPRSVVARPMPELPSVRYAMFTRAHASPSTQVERLTQALSRSLEER